MKIAVILAFSLCLIAYSDAGDKGCCPDVACAEGTIIVCPITEGAAESCKYMFDDPTDPAKPATNFTCVLKPTTIVDGQQCDSEKAEAQCFCDPAEAADAVTCFTKTRKDLKPYKSGTPAMKKCCVEAGCTTTVDCPAAQEFCSWSTTGEATMTGGACAAEGEKLEGATDTNICKDNMAATTCSCKNADAVDQCNKEFKRENWAPKVGGGDAPTPPPNPTTPAPVETTAEGGSASVRATILTTVYPVITILGVALFSFSPA